MEYNNATFMRRLFAWLIDILVTVLIVFLCLYFSAKFLKPFSPPDLINIGNIITVNIVGLFLSAIINLAYQIIFVSRFGGTLGKLLMGIEILRQDDPTHIDAKTALYRITAGYMFSSQFFGLGYFRIINSPDKRAWHDELFGTRVVVKHNPAAGIISLILMIILIVVLAGMTVGEIVTKAGSYTSTNSEEILFK